MLSSRQIFACLCLVQLLTLGCGKSGGLDKVTVEGEITYKGQPIENGEIWFRPTEGTVGPVSGGSIANGHYRVDAKGGVPVGKHVVQIKAIGSRGSGGSSEMIAGGGGAVEVNYLPDKYHRASELTLEVPGDSKTFTHDFTLEE